MEIMRIIWEKDGEMTSSELTEKLSNVWKPTTI